MPDDAGSIFGSRSVIDALPVGIALYDDERRLVLANGALFRLIGLQPASFRPLSSFADNIRVMARRGLLGPGDPDTLTVDALRLEDGLERRFRRNHPDGRSHQSHYVPLRDGGLLVCLTDTSDLLAMRDDAERTVSRVQGAIATLQIGVAVFSAERRLELFNRRLPELLGLAPTGLEAGMPFDEVLRALDARHERLGLEDAFAAGIEVRGKIRLRRNRASGQVIEIEAEPLADGGLSLTVADVTALVRAEDDVQRQASLLDNILLLLPDGISVFGPDRRLVMVNEAYRRIMDGAPGDIGDTLEEVVRARIEAGEYLDADPDAYVQGILGIEVGAVRVSRRRRPTGTTIEVRTTALADGSHVSVVSDVTASLAEEDEAKRQADLLSSIVDQIPLGISVYGPDRRLRMVNEAYRAIMEGAPIEVGETVDEIIERRARAGEYGPGDPMDRMRAQRRQDNTKPQFRRRQRPGGQTIDVRTAPLPDGSHISIVANVTPLISAETELARRAETMDAMLANIRHGIVLWDKDGRILAANPVVAKMLNAPPGLLVPGRTLADVTQSALERGNLGDGETAEVRARWLMEQDRGQPHTDQRLTRDGRVLEVRSDPIAGGGFVTTYTDVTHIRQAEEALRLSKSAAEAANAAKSRFLAGMSAELRTPLATILEETGSLARVAGEQIAAESGPGGLRVMDAGALAGSVKTIGTEARNLLGVIDTILDVARLESGRFDLEESTVDVLQLVRAMLRTFDAAAAAAEVALVVDLPEYLPFLRADERRLRQAVYNAVSNALRVTPPLGSVTIGARRDWTTGGLRLHVSDTGPGIAAADLERVFEPFAHIDGAGGARTDEAVPPGSGLGLYVSRILMRAHGGDLTLRSVLGQGTAVTLHVPSDRTLQQGIRDIT